MSEKIFPIWKTIELGTEPQDADELLQAIEDKGCKVSNLAKDIIRKLAFTVSSEKTKLDLVVVSGLDLGFTRYNVARKNIYKRAISRGLGLCSTEAALQLILQLMLQGKNQLKDEYWAITIAMEPIEGFMGVPCVFHIEYVGNDFHLDIRHVYPNWDPLSRWVFALCK